MKAKQDVLNLSLVKHSIVELSDSDIKNINGGSSDFIESIIRVTTYGTWIDFL